MTLHTAPLLLLVALAPLDPAAPSAEGARATLQEVETAKEGESGHRYPVTAESVLPQRDDAQAKEATAHRPTPEPAAEEKPKKLHLLGMGIREKTILAVNVYSYALFVDEAFVKEKLTPWKGQREKDVEKDSKLFGTLLGEGGTKELRLRFCRSVDADDVVSAFEDSLEPRILNKLRNEKGTEEAKLEVLETFRKMFDLDKLKSGNELRFTWHPDGTLSTVINGERQKDLKSPALCWALFDVYLGKDPISKSSKKKLVRRTPDVVAAVGS